MDLQSSINKYNGQKNVGNTPENKGQCVGLVMVWLRDTLQLPHIWGHARDLLVNADRGAYEVIKNTPTGVPPRGAVLVFKESFNGYYDKAGKYVKGFGHTGIVTRADLNTFELFEQNMPLGNGCRLHTYPNYNHVDGWIVPKNIKDDSANNYYKGYDLTNKDSMKVAVDLLARVQAGELVEKSLLTEAQEKIKELEKRPVSCPPAISRRAELEQIRDIVDKALR